MLIIWTIALFAIAALAVARFVAHLQALAMETRPYKAIDVNRYRPMLRLLRDEECKFASSKAVSTRRLRAQRRTIFRGYLECLTKDYNAVLGAIRGVMVRSAIDRPDLAKALLKNRVLFAVALCAIDLHLCLHAAGVGRVEVSGLVGALDALHQQAHTLIDSTVWGS
jgi:hypothetical protein